MNPIILSKTEIRLSFCSSIANVVAPFKIINIRKSLQGLELPGDCLFNLYVCNYVKIRKILMMIDIFQNTFDVFIKINNISSLKMPNLFIENERMSKSFGDIFRTAPLWQILRPSLKTTPWLSRLRGPTFSRSKMVL